MTKPCAALPYATLKPIAADPDMAQGAQIDNLLASYVYEQALVELRSQHAERELSKEAVTKLENCLKHYIVKKAKRCGVICSGAF